MTAYSTLLRPLLFRLDPEAAHHLAIAAGAHLGWAGPAMRIATRVDDDSLATEVAGLHFPTPIGLAAGFDKSGTAIPALAGLGFGAIEIGSVSVDASVGNHDAAHVHVLSGGTDPVGQGALGCSMGSIVTRLRGASHPVSGIPGVCAR